MAKDKKLFQRENFLLRSETLTQKNCTSQVRRNEKCFVNKNVISTFENSCSIEARSRGIVENWNETFTRSLRLRKWMVVRPKETDF